MKKPIKHDKSCPCPECRAKARSGRSPWPAIICAIVAAVCLYLLFGCASTVTPTTVAPQQASFDGNDQNSGIIKFTADGFLVTPHFRDRYNGLVDVYGRDFSPALQHDDGIRRAPDNINFLIDAEHLSKLVTMNLKKKSGISP